MMVNPRKRIVIIRFIFTDLTESIPNSKVPSEAFGEGILNLGMGKIYTHG